MSFAHLGPEDSWGGPPRVGAKQAYNCELQEKRIIYFVFGRLQEGDEINL